MTTIARRFGHLAILTAFCCLGLARGDVVTLKDGRVFEGTILEETNAKVVIDTKVANIRSTETFPKFRVASIDRKPLPEGFFDDPSPREDDAREPVRAPERAPEPAGRAPERPAREPTAREEEDEDDDARGAPNERTRYAVVPVQGGIGREVSAYALREAFDDIRKRRVEHVVLVVDSPGGYVYEANQILETLGEYDGALTYHVYIDGGAISAATVFAASADYLYVAPEARLGGAVAYTESSSSGAAEVDAKFNSIWASELASRAEAKGHNADAFRAMVVQDAELWLAPDGSLSAQRPGAGAEQLDTRSTILTLTGAQMIRAGIAEALPGGPDSIGEARGLPGWTVMRGLGERAVEKAAGERERLDERRAKALDVLERATKDLAREDPRTKSYTIVVMTRTRKRGMEGDSMQRWVRHSDAALKAVNLQIAALEELGDVHRRAKQIGAMHLLLDSREGDKAYRDAVSTCDWLAAHRTNPPVDTMAVSNP